RMIFAQLASHIRQTLTRILRLIGAGGTVVAGWNGWGFLRNTRANRACNQNADERFHGHHPQGTTVGGSGQEYLVGIGGGTYRSDCTIDAEESRVAFLNRITSSYVAALNDESKLSTLNQSVEGAPQELARQRRLPPALEKRRGHFGGCS